MLLPGKLSTPKARTTGYLGNAIAGSALGVATTYLITVTGKDNALSKGSAVGLAAWLSLHGLFVSVRGASVRPAIPKDMLSQFIGHSVFGAVTGLIAAGLGDPELFSKEQSYGFQEQRHSQEKGNFGRKRQRKGVIHRMSQAGQGNL